MGDSTVLSSVALALALLVLWREVRRLGLQGDADSLRIKVLSKRLDLVTRALRRQRDPEKTVRMTAEELEAAKKNRNSLP